MKNFDNLNNPSQEEESSVNPEQQDVVDKAVENILQSNFNVLEEIDSKLQQVIVFKLIEIGNVDLVMENLESFQSLDYSEIVLQLLEMNNGGVIGQNIDKFQGLNQEVVSKIVKIRGGERLIIENLESFQNIDYLEIVLKLIEDAPSHVEPIFKYLDKFEKFNQEISLELINAGYDIYVMEHLDKCEVDQEAILRFIELNHLDFIIQHLDRFQDLDQEIALRLIELGKERSVIENLDKFKDFNQEIALKLIEKREGRFVAIYLEKFEGLNHKEIALKLIEKGEGAAVAIHLEKFEGLNYKEIALKLIEKGEGYFLVENLEKFEGLNYKEIALKLIEAKQVHCVVKNLEKFEGLKHQEIVLKLIELNDIISVAIHLEKFEGLNYKEIALKLIEKGEGELLVEKLDTFQDLDQEIALKIIEIGGGWHVARNLDKFQDLDHQEFALKLIEIGKAVFIVEYLDKFQDLDQEIALELIEAGYFKQVLDNLEDSFLDNLEDKFSLKAYKVDLSIASKDIYDKYIELKREGNEIKLTGYIEKIKDKIDSLISSGSQDENISEQENYQELVESVYPNHANDWTDFDSNETCLDRSSDLDRFKIKDVYEIDLSEGVEMELRDGEEKSEENIKYLEQSIVSIQKKFSEVAFEKDKMLEILDDVIDGYIENLPNKEVFKTREEKVYALLLESLVDEFDAQELKEVLIGYQFAEFEDIKTYLEGSRNRAGEAKNPDYAYLLELREFFADHVKEVERKIATEAQSNPDIIALLPTYYSQKTDLENSNTRQDDINKLRLDQLGLNGNILERIMKELSKQTDKKGNPFELAELDENNELKAGKKGKTIAGMIMSEQKKVAKAIKTLTGKELDPKSIHLGELNLEEYLKASDEIKAGQYDEELFSRYLVQAFQGVFEKELSIIDKEIAKYKPEDEKQKEKQRRKLECFITKNHTSAHARGVGGVCVSGDNPDKGEECQWNLENYFQMVLRDKEAKICQGLVLLHYYEDDGKKILTASFNPSSTYLYKVNETQLFDSLLDQLTKFAEDNDIDTIAVNKNEQIRTNRTGGEFEGAINNAIRKENKEVGLSEAKAFSFEPKYHQQDLDVIWERE